LLYNRTGGVMVSVLASSVILRSWAGVLIRSNLVFAAYPLSTQH